MQMYRRRGSNPHEARASKDFKSPAYTIPPRRPFSLLPQIDVHDDDKRKSGAPNRIRTCDLRFRKPMLYPAELWAPRKPHSRLPQKF